MTDDLTPLIFAQICGCRRPHDPNQYPRVEYTKQYSPDQSDHLQTVYGCTLQDFMREYDIPEDGPPETTAPPDFTRPPRESFRPLHHNTMNTITLSRPTWASKAYESSFDNKEPATNHFTPKRFTRSYAAVTSNKKSKQSSDTQQSTQQPQTSAPTKPSVPSTAPTGPLPSEPSTLTPQSELRKTTTLVTPTKAPGQDAMVRDDPFVKQTEQNFIDIRRELMEIRTGRQAMYTRVVQMEKKSDKLLVQMQELMKSTSKIIAKLSDPEEMVPPSQATSTESRKEDEEEYLTDRDLKKFRKKVERVLDDAFNNFGTEMSTTLKNIEERLNSRLDNLVGVSDTQEEEDEDEDDDSDVEMETSDGELEVDESKSQGSSADSALPDTTVTAAGQSPTKKQKGVPSSDTT